MLSRAVSPNGARLRERYALARVTDERADRRGDSPHAACTSVGGMTTHRGTAVLLLENGSKFDTEAALTKDASGSWSGTLTFHDATLFRDLLNVTDGHLLVNGQPGEFIRPDTSDWAANPNGPRVMRILGSGPAPF